MFDYTQGATKLAYHCAQTAAIYEGYRGTCAALMRKECGWNCAMSAFIQSLINTGLTVTLFA